MSENDEISKYSEVINILHKKSSPLIGFMLIVKQYFTNNIYFYYVSFLFRFFYIFVVIGDFESLQSGSNEYSMGTFLQKVTSYNLVGITSMNETQYCYICIVILILFLIRIFCYTFVYLKIKKNIYSIIVPYKYQILFDHIFFLFYPFLLEFISFIFNEQISPRENFLYVGGKKKNHPKYLSLATCIINAILIIGYNIINIFFMFIIDKNFYSTEKEAYESINSSQKTKAIPPFQINYDFYIKIIICLFQNAFVLSGLPFILHSEKSYFAFKYTFNSITLLILLILCIANLKTYSYNTNLNKFIGLLSFFIFISIIYDLLKAFFSYKVDTTIKSICYILIKLLNSFIFYNLYENYLNKRILTKNLEKELFKLRKGVDKNDEVYLYNIYMYLNELIFKLNVEKDKYSAYTLLNIFKSHIKSCRVNNCKCKLLDLKYTTSLIAKMLRNSKENSNLSKYMDKLIINVNFLLESSFVETNITNSYYIAILLAEHFCYSKNKPIMALTLIQTVINKQSSTLSILKLLYLYELSLKYIYINSGLRLGFEVNDISSYQNSEIKILKEINIEKEYKNYLSLLSKTKKILKFMQLYSEQLILFSKFKMEFEDSLTFRRDEETQEILDVTTNFFEKFEKSKDVFQKTKDEKNLNNLAILFNNLKNESFIYNKIINLILNIENYKEIPIDFLFKCFLFFDLYNGGKIDVKTNKILSNLLKNKSILDNIINKKIYKYLIDIYENLYEKDSSVYFLIFKHKKNISIKYFDENLALKLEYQQNELINQDISILFPEEFSKAHSSLISTIFIARNVRSLKNKNIFLFNKTHLYMTPTIMDGSIVAGLEKNLLFIMKARTFDNTNDYNIFMDKSFEPISYTKNIENDYSISMDLLHRFNFSILDLLKINKKELSDKFALDLKEINKKKYYLDGDTEKYFVDQIITKEIKYNKQSYGNNTDTKNYYTHQNKFHLLDDIKTREIEDLENNDKQLTNEKKNKIKILEKINENKKQEKTNYKFVFKQVEERLFLDNLWTALSKITDEDLMHETYQGLNSSVTSAKKKILKKMNNVGSLTGENKLLNISIKLIFHYDTCFYLFKINCISIRDPKKESIHYIKTYKFLQTNYKDGMTGYIQSETSEESSPCNSKIFNLNTANNYKSNLEIIQESNDEKKNTLSTNINLINEEIENKLIGNNKVGQNNEITNNYLIENENKTKLTTEKKTRKIKERPSIDNFKQELEINHIHENYDLYGHTICFIYFNAILLIIFVITMCVYIIIMIYQGQMITSSSLIFLSYFHGFHLNDQIINIHSALLTSYNDILNLTTNQLFNVNDDIFVINFVSNLLKENYHIFEKSYFAYKIQIKSDLDFFYAENNLTKINPDWSQTFYLSEFDLEMKAIIYKAYQTAANTKKKYNSIDNINYINLFKYFHLKENKCFDSLNNINFSNNTKLDDFFLPLLFYLNNNYNSVWHNFFKEFRNNQINSFEKYMEESKIVYIILETLGFLLFCFFFVCCIYYFNISNKNVFRNILTIFLDYLQDDNYKIKESKDNFNVIKKIKNFEIILKDFNLENFYQYKIGDENNFNKTLYIQNTQENSENANLFKQELKDKSASKKFVNSVKSKNITINNSSFLKEKNLLDLSQSNLNQSSFALLKDLSNNQNLISNDVTLTDKKNTTNTTENLKNNETTNKNKKFKMSAIKNKNQKNMELNKKKQKENKLSNEALKEILYEHIIEKKLSKYKYYTFLVIIFFIITAGYFIFKITFSLQFSDKIREIFDDSGIIINRYSMIFYYFNTLRSLIMMPNENYEKIMEQMDQNFIEENDKYYNILNTRLKNYENTYELFQICMNNQNGVKAYVRDTICKDRPRCQKYVMSEYSLYDSGVDFAFKSSLSEIGNFFMDYKLHKNEFCDFDTIRDKIINKKFILTDLAMTNVLIFTKERIFTAFLKDEDYIEDKFNKQIKILNICALIFCLIVFIIFISIFFLGEQKFIGTVQEVVYRINESLFNVKTESNE